MNRVQGRLSWQEGIDQQPDKALAEIDGETFAERAASARAPNVSFTLVATGPIAREYPIAARVVLDPVEDGVRLPDLLSA